MADSSIEASRIRDRDRYTGTALAQLLLLFGQGHSAISVEGAGGCGKSYMCEAAALDLVKKPGWNREDVCWVALQRYSLPSDLEFTSSVPVSTLHSFLGIGIGHGTRSHLIKMGVNHLKSKRELRILFVDECGLLCARMVDILFEILDRAGWTTNVVFICDFRQLNPIPIDKSVYETCMQMCGEEYTEAEIESVVEESKKHALKVLSFRSV